MKIKIGAIVKIYGREEKIKILGFVPETEQFWGQKINNKTVAKYYIDNIVA